MSFKYYVQSWKGIPPDAEQNEDQPSAPKVKDLTLTEELGEAVVVNIKNVFHCCPCQTCAYKASRSDGTMHGGSGY